MKNDIYNPGHFRVAQKFVEFNYIWDVTLIPKQYSYRLIFFLVYIKEYLLGISETEQKRRDFCKHNWDKLFELV